MKEKIPTTEETNPPVLAYFYPLTTNCPERQARAQEIGVTLQDETQMCQGARPLFEGHNQPATYCLDNKAGETTTWDDTDPQAMNAQIKLATMHKIGGFIFDIFVGEKKRATCT